MHSKDISTITAARMLGGLKVAIQSMRNAGIDDTDNTQKKDISNQFLEKRKKHVRRLPSEYAKDEGIDVKPQQKFGTWHI